MKLFKSKMGEGYVWPCVITLILCMILTVVIYFISAVSVIKIQKEDTKKVLDCFVTKNAIEIYNSIKTGNDTQNSLNSTVFRNELCSFCNLDINGKMLYCYDENENIKYYLTEPILTSDRNLKITAEYTLYVPIYFNGLRVTTAEIPVRIKAYYTEKF